LGAIFYSRGRFKVSASSRGVLAGAGALDGGVLLGVAGAFAGGERIVSAAFDRVSRAACASRWARRSI
jgi:hypothetical protein